MVKKASVRIVASCNPSPVTKLIDADDLGRSGPRRADGDDARGVVLREVGTHAPRGDDGRGGCGGRCDGCCDGGGAGEGARRAGAGECARAGAGLGGDAARAGCCCAHALAARCGVGDAPRTGWR